MGSWKETCMMSNLPIHCGDEVAAFVLRPTYNVDEEGTVCYADDRYAPVGFPVRGKYDDYGCVEQITNAEMHDTLFRQNQYYIKTGTDAYGDTDTTLGGATFTLSNATYTDTATSDANGRVRFDNVPDGTYTLAETAISTELAIWW